MPDKEHADPFVDPFTDSLAGEAIDLGFDLKANASKSQPESSPEYNKYASLLTDQPLTDTQFTRETLKIEEVTPAFVPHQEEHSSFSWNELPLVLSHYKLGVIKRIELFKRGSRQAPKAVVASQAGVFLLKRREASDETRARIAISHRIQKYLIDAQFPTPALMGTARSGSTLVHLTGHFYELFHFILGESFDRSPLASASAGNALGLMHNALENFEPLKNTPSGSFHNSPVTPRAFSRAQESFERLLPPSAIAAAVTNLQTLAKELAQVAKTADGFGIASLKPIMGHGDWHPGNMLYNKEMQIIGVVDYDSIRLQNPLLDLAYGAMQFSLVKSNDPSRLADHLDMERLQAFVCAYLRIHPIAPEQVKALPWLMAEAMAVEIVLPIAAHGYFVGVRGDIMVEAVRKKLHWLVSHAEEMNQAVAQGLAQTSLR